MVASFPFLKSIPLYTGWWRSTTSAVREYLTSRFCLKNPHKRVSREDRIAEDPASECGHWRGRDPFTSRQTQRKIKGSKDVCVLECFWGSEVQKKKSYCMLVSIISVFHHSRISRLTGIKQAEGKPTTEWMERRKGSTQTSQSSSGHECCIVRR